MNKPLLAVASMAEALTGVGLMVAPSLLTDADVVRRGSCWVVLISCESQHEGSFLQKQVLPL